MEATTISPESINSLFNSGASNGTLQTGPGSALPFSTILQSQQQSKLAANSPLATNSEFLRNQMYSTDGSEALSLDQLSLSGRNGTAAAPWLVLGLQEGSTQGLGASSLVEEQEVLPASMPEIQAVPFQAEQLVTPDLPPSELEQTAALNPEQSKAAQRTLELAALAQRSQDGVLRDESNSLRNSSGGGGSNRPNAGLEAELTGVSAEYLQVQDGLSTVDSEQLRAPTLTTSQLGANSKTIDGPIVGQRADGVSLSSDVTTAGEAVLDASIGDQTVTAELNSARAMAASGSTGDLNQSVRLESVTEQNGQVVLADSEATALDSDLALRAVSGSATTVDGTLKPLDSGVPLPVGSLSANGPLQRPEPATAGDLNSATSGQSLSSASQSKGEINIESTDLITTLNETVEVTGAAASLGASVADPLSNQIRNAVPVQAKRTGANESVDVATAVDASDGYHWLSGVADAAPESTAELPQTGVLENSDGAALTTANNSASTANNARSEAAVVESFAAAKRSADVAVNSGNTATNSAEQTNSANLEIDTPVQDAQWSQALAYRVQFMAQEGIQRAQVQLNPVELGPIEITVDIADDVAKVQITAENAATREAVEQAVPRLREMMALSGFNETGVDLSNGNEEHNAPSASAESLNQSNTGAGGDKGSRDGDSGTEGQNTSGIKTLSGNEVPQRSSDGRLSFYV